MGRPPRDFAVEAVAFGDHPLVIIAPPDHRLVGRKGLRLQTDLADETFLVREEGSGTRAVFEQLTAGVVVKRSRFGIDIGSNETIKQAVIAGLGVALISAHTIAAELESGRLALLDVEGVPVRRQWFAVRRADKALGPAASAFWDFLVTKGAQWLPEPPRVHFAAKARRS
jgi:LysR family transcriptional regulator, low CO2-responsive transcriptional regulator